MAFPLYTGSGQAIALIYLDKCSKNRYFRPLKPPFRGQSNRCKKPAAVEVGTRFLFLKPFAPCVEACSTTPFLS
jgi:hypothetical protein